MSKDALWAFSAEARQAVETESRLARERQRDRQIADAEAHHALADLHMPEDLRTQAATWKLEAFMQAVWRQGWQSGFRLGTSRRLTSEAPEDGTTIVGGTS